MADKRKEYKVTINGSEHTVLLNAEDVERYGKAAVEVKARPADNKAGSAQNK